MLPGSFAIGRNRQRPFGRLAWGLRRGPARRTLAPAARLPAALAVQPHLLDEVAPRGVVGFKGY